TTVVRDRVRTVTISRLQRFMDHSLSTRPSRPAAANPTRKCGRGTDLSERNGFAREARRPFGSRFKEQFQCRLVPVYEELFQAMVGMAVMLLAFGNRLLGRVNV